MGTLRSLKEVRGIGPHSQPGKVDGWAWSQSAAAFKHSRKWCWFCNRRCHAMSSNQGPRLNAGVFPRSLSCVMMCAPMVLSVCYRLLAWLEPWGVETTGVRVRANLSLSNVYAAGEPRVRCGGLAHVPDQRAAVAAGAQPHVEAHCAGHDSPACPFPAFTTMHSWHRGRAKYKTTKDSIRHNKLLPCMRLPRARCGPGAAGLSDTLVRVPRAEAACAGQALFGASGETGNAYRVEVANIATRLSTVFAALNVRARGCVFSATLPLRWPW